MLVQIANILRFQNTFLNFKSIFLVYSLNVVNKIQKCYDSENRKLKK